MNLVYVLFLHYATATTGALYDSAALIGPVDASQCIAQLPSMQIDTGYSVCATVKKALTALDSYGCHNTNVRVDNGVDVLEYACK